VSRSEETQPAAVYSLRLVMWEGDQVPPAEEIEKAIWDGLNLAFGQQCCPASVEVFASPFNPTERS